MAKKRLRIKDSSGNVVPYDVAASDVTMNNGQDLETAFEGVGDGTVKSVTLNGTTFEPDDNGDVALTLPEVDVDDVLDEDSENAIKNKTVTAAIAQLREAIESVIGEGSTEAIENFQEVLDFLENVNDEETLIGLLNTMNTAISGKVAKSDVYNGLDRTTEGKVLDARQGKALNDLIAALQSGKSDKSETVSGLSYDVLSHKLKQTVNGNVSDVATVDTKPTANSDNFVTSGGVSTALATLLANIHIGQNGNWFIGNTDTNVQAQGPAGNCAITGDGSNIVSLIVNNMTTGGSGNILSAEMGKRLKTAIVTIMDSIGEYAFPNGKPTIDLAALYFDITCTLPTGVTQTNDATTILEDSVYENKIVASAGYRLTAVTVNGESQTIVNNQCKIKIKRVAGDITISVTAEAATTYNVALNLTNCSAETTSANMVAGSVFSVIVTPDAMCDLPLAISVVGSNTYSWDNTTGALSITIESGNVAVTITAIADTIANYAQQSHLVFQLDGLKKGPNAGKWTDLKGGVVWDNHGATELSDCWQFDGSSYLDSQNMVAHEPRTGTIEIVLDSGLTNQAFVAFTDGSKMVLAYAYNNQNCDWWDIRGFTGGVSGYGGMTAGPSSRDNGHGKKIVSVTGNDENTTAGRVNGVSCTAGGTYYGCGTKALIGGRWNNDTFERIFTGKIYAIRIYDICLSMSDILANQQLDNQRFNLGLTI